MIFKKNKVITFTDNHPVCKQDIQYKSSAGWMMADMTKTKFGWKDNLKCYVTDRSIGKLNRTRIVGKDLADA